MKRPSNISITLQSIPQGSTQSTDSASTDLFTSWMAIAFPIFVVIAIVIYRKHQTRIRRQRIQRLKRIWQLDSSKTLFFYSKNSPPLGNKFYTAFPCQGDSGLRT